MNSLQKMCEINDERKNENENNNNSKTKIEKEKKQLRSNNRYWQTCQYNNNAVEI